MKVFTNNQFKGHWLIGAAVIVAENVEQAVSVLESKLREQGLSQSVNIADMQEIDLEFIDAYVLWDGNY